MLRTIPGYKKALKGSTRKALEDFEKMLRENWNDDDETLNEGDSDYDEEFDDEVYDN